MNKQNLKKTKIYSTFGPSVTQKIWDEKILKADKAQTKKAYQMVEGVIKAGVNVVRLNFSHGTHDEQKVRADIARDVAKKLNLPISILFDTKGPEIRVCPLKDGAIVINQGDSVTIECLKKIEGTNSSFSVTDASGKYNMAKDCKVGNVVCVDDGKLRLTIKRVDVKAGKVFTTAVNSHKVTTNKRINLPGANYSMPFLSEKDINDTKFACQQGYEYLAASFANSAEDINSIKNICNSCGTNGKNIKILAKIETLTACNNLQSIIDSCDGCMVARGDLGIEIPFYDVPYWQNKIIELCRKAGKLCVVATQMLDSMESRVVPSRAEVTDVFYAVENGSDATMLSGETASGMFPIEAVSTMATIDKASENLFCYCGAIEEADKNIGFKSANKKIAQEIANKTKPANCGTAEAKFPYEFAIVFTDDEDLIAAISAYRPGAAVIICTTKKSLFNKFGAYYGIYTYLVSKSSPKATAAKNAVNLYGTGSKKYFIYGSTKK